MRSGTATTPPGAPVSASKASEAGRKRRLALLADVLPAARTLYETVLEETYRRDVARDDVLDALVLAAVADRSLTSLPAEPPLDAAGLPMEIVHPA